MASAAFWKLRRLAPRAERVLRRRGAVSAAIAAYAATLAAKITAFVRAYDAASRYSSKWKKEMTEGRGAAAKLLKLIQQWTPHLVRDVPGFDASTFGDKPDVPDDVIADGERLLDTIDDHRDGGGAMLTYREAGMNEIGPVLASAVSEWTEAEEADRKYQDLLATVRDTGSVFDAELQLFRRTLGAVVGHSDRDYQKLRSEKAPVADEDDDAGAPSAAVVPAAASGTPPPQS